MVKTEAGETRNGWLIALVLGVVAGLWALSSALGFQTPAAQVAEVKDHQKVQDAKLDDHDARIQRLEDQKLTLEAIARAVGADIPKNRRTSR